MEVDLARLYAVGLRLCLGDEAVDPPGLLPHRLRQREGVDHGVDIRQRAVLVMVILMMVMHAAALMPLLLSMDVHPHMGPGDPLAGDALGLQLHAGNQGVHVRQEPLLLRVQLVQRAHEHIPCRAHGALQIQCFHWSIPFI